MTIRSDNADARLTSKARAFGVVSDNRWEAYERSRQEVEHADKLLRDHVLSPQGWIGLGFECRRDGVMRRSVMVVLEQGAHIDIVAALSTFYAILSSRLRIYCRTSLGLETSVHGHWRD
jgi:tRNA U34 5-carboxymethylaminomethyl modifying enzyme MnmG/GidA